MSESTHPTDDLDEPFRDPRLIAPDDAYVLMAPFAVTSSSSAAEILRAGMAAQREGAGWSACNKAWSDLRNSERRLALDLLFHHPGGFDGVVAPDPPAEDDEP
jgi:hypothetical protein